jgi:hypothetical protein
MSRTADRTHSIVLDALTHIEIENAGKQPRYTPYLDLSRRKPPAAEADINRRRVIPRRGRDLRTKLNF